MNLTVTTIVLIVIALLILKFAGKFFSKLIGLAILLAVAFGFLYIKGWGPFESNLADMDHLEEKYCNEGDQDVCDCIVTKLKQDISSRFSPEELEQLKTEKLESAYILKKSMNAQKEHMKACLAARGQEDKYKQFIKDFVPIQNKYLDVVEEKAKDLGNKLKDEIESAEFIKKEIDEKY